MAGKGYTIRERKCIVDYIKENNLYDAIKGRKMWMDFASTKLTSRTWQSLKETFIKRIITDIHNPYYALAPDEISSFRVGFSMIRNHNHKLTVQKSSTAKETASDAWEDNEDVKIVDDDKKTEVPRCASAETVIYEPRRRPYYENTSDIEKVLKSDDEKDNIIGRSTPNTSDGIANGDIEKIVVSPIVNLILNDFTADDENNTSNKDPESSQEKSSEEPKTAPEASEKAVDKNSTTDKSVVLRKKQGKNQGKKRGSSQSSTDSTVLLNKKKKDNDKEKNTNDHENVNLRGTENEVSHIESPKRLPDSTLLEPSSEPLPSNQQEFRAREINQASESTKSDNLTNDVIKQTRKSTPKPQPKNTGNPIEAKKNNEDPWYCKPSTSKASFDDLMAKINNVTTIDKSESISEKGISEKGISEKEISEKEISEKDDEEKKSQGALTTDLLSDSSQSEDEGQFNHDIPKTFQQPKSTGSRNPFKGTFATLDGEGGQLFIYGDQHGAQHAYQVFYNDNGMKRNVALKVSSDDYWRKKYDRVKKSKERMKIMLKNRKKQISLPPKHKSTILMDHKTRKSPSPPPIRRTIYAPRFPQDSNGIVNIVDERGEIVTNKPDDYIKYTFTKDDHVSTIEGNWKSVRTALKDLLDIFQVTQPTDSKGMCDEATNCPSPSLVVIDDGKDTEITKRTRGKNAGASKRGTSKGSIRNIDEMEEEIFNEIVELDKSGGASYNDKENITKRKSTNPAEPTEQLTNGDSEVIVNEDKLQLIEDKTAPRRSARAYVPKASTSAAKTLRSSRSAKRPRRFCMKSGQEPNINTNKSSSDLMENTQECRKENSSVPNLKHYFENKRTNLNLSLQPNQMAFVPDNFVDHNKSSNQPPVLYIDTADSNIYRTESFDILMQNTGKLHNSKLDRINEVDTSSSENVDLEVNSQFDLSPASQTIIIQVDRETNSNKSNASERSSINNRSPSESPEISIIENITINKEFLHTVPIEIPNFEQSPISNVDEEISSILEDRIEKGIEIDKMSVDRTHSTSDVMGVPRQILRTLETPLNVKASIEANVSQTLNERLSNMMLDSAKKLMTNLKKKSKVVENRKRSSTPHRRIKKSNSDLLDERMEHCTKIKSRRSCPPVIHNIENNSRITQVETVKQKPKERKKREIIKVKIVRPKEKAKKSAISEPGVSGDENNDSESGIFLHGFNDTVDLIHNHSDTCLQTNECLDDSGDVLIIDNDNDVISLDSSALEPARCSVNGTEHSYDKELCIDSLLDKAQDCTTFSSVTTTEGCEPKENSCNSSSSILTEDLSDDNPMVSKWYLLSDEETNIETQSLPSSSNYLEKLFPISYAVPDLSTISEKSRDVGDSNANTK